jgi:tRNA1Val (adenine37-N6)-methyltransferase
MSARTMKTAGPRPRSGETLGTFYRGRILVLQKRRGYRFSVDAPLLADFIRTRRSDDILEVGTGSGIIPLLLGSRPFRRITAIEIQRGLAALAKRNVALNGLEDRVEVVRADYRGFRPGRKFDLVISNPPYIKKAGGYLSRVTEKAIAKHEIRGGIGDLMRKTAEWLKPGGRACFVFPERRRRDFVEAAAANGLLVRRMRFVLPRRDEPANLFLAELGFAARGAKKTALPPLVLFRRVGEYTAEAEAIFSGRRP